MLLNGSSTLRIWWMCELLFCRLHWHSGHGTIMGIRSCQLSVTGQLSFKRHQHVKHLSQLSLISISGVYTNWTRSSDAPFESGQASYRRLISLSHMLAFYFVTLLTHSHEMCPIKAASDSTTQELCRAESSWGFELIKRVYRFIVKDHSAGFVALPQTSAVLPRFVLFFSDFEYAALIVNWNRANQSSNETGTEDWCKHGNCIIAILCLLTRVTLCSVSGAMCYMTDLFSLLQVPDFFYFHFHVKRNSRLLSICVVLAPPWTKWFLLIL